MAVAADCRTGERRAHRAGGTRRRGAVVRHHHRRSGEVPGRCDVHTLTWSAPPRRVARRRIAVTCTPQRGAGPDDRVRRGQPTLMAGCRPSSAHRRAGCAVRPRAALDPRSRRTLPGVASAGSPLLGLRAAARRGPGRQAAAAPRRRHRRRQPALGQGDGLRRSRTTATASARAKIEELLHWCDEAGVEDVTLWLLSTDNLRRPAAELDPLLRIIENLVTELADDGQPWDLRIGRRARPAARARPRACSRRPRSAPTAAPGPQVNIAVGYGGRREIADAVRSLLHEHASTGTTIEELAEILDVDHIAEHLYTSGQPDPDLVIRTSRRAAALRLPAVAERALGVLLLRRVLARLPPGRLPAGAARLRQPAAPLRRLTLPTVRLSDSVHLRWRLPSRRTSAVRGSTVRRIAAGTGVPSKR